jgi:hypothetical protein
MEVLSRETLKLAETQEVRKALEQLFDREGPRRTEGDVIPVVVSNERLNVRRVGIE